MKTTTPSLALILALVPALPAAAETFSVTLHDVPYSTSVPVDFQRELGDVARVEITLTSEMGPVSVCWEEWDGTFTSYPCGNLTVIRCGGAAMAIDGLGTIDHQVYDAWYDAASATREPMTDWSFLASGTTDIALGCYPDGCSADWIHGQGYCGPDIFQVSELTITVETGVVPTETMAWGRIKAMFR